MRRISAVLVVVAMIFAAQCARVHVSSRRDAVAHAQERDPGQSRAVDRDRAFRVDVDSAGPPAYVTHDDEGARLWKATRDFYAHRDFEPAWSDNGAPRPQVDALITAIHASSREGLNAEIYDVTLLDQRKSEWTRRGRLDAKDAGDADAWLTYLYMKYASDMADGLSDLPGKDGNWKIKSESFDSIPQLEAALRDNRVGESLTALAPADPEYSGLRTALAEYRAQAERGGWPAVPTTMKLKPGQQSADVAILARRLAASGDYKGSVPADAAPAVYGPELQEAVKTFQRRHGLGDDAAVGPAVVAELNVPADARVRQIELNMERWRWLPRNLGERHILVNIPEMRLDVRDHGTVPVSMRVVVGKPGTPTPVFNADMKYLVFAPYWNIPPDIARKETVPRAMRDPGFLDRSNMEVVDGSGRTIDSGSVDLGNLGTYRLRQRPGTSNSLGLVKFMLPNPYDVYLHDTPADSLFARASRPFSHGCVRLEEPQKLAEYVLRDQPEWTPERIDEAMHGSGERTVKLGAPLPVYIGYWTARAGSDGSVQFRKDVYGLDGPLMTQFIDRQDPLRKGMTASLKGVNALRPVGTTGR